MGKRPRIRKVKSFLIKDKTIEALAELCEVNYNIAFDAYIWANECDPQYRLNHAKNRIEMFKKGIVKKVS